MAHAPEPGTVWGDVDDLVAVLDVQPDGDGFTSVTVPDQRRPVVEASQILGQSIVAASRRAPGRRVVSAHLVALRPADANEPLRFELDELSAGRTFSAYAVHAWQGGRRCASTQLLLDVTAPDVIRHAEPPPEGPRPEGAVPCDMGVTGRDLRIVDGAYTDDPAAPVGPPELGVWLRYREVPQDPVLHAALLAQLTGHFPIAAALRPHAGVGQAEAHRTLSTAINAIALSFHAEVRAARWLRYHHRSTIAADGMTHAECRVHDEPGALVASFTVDAMVRPLTTRPADGRPLL